MLSMFKTTMLLPSHRPWRSELGRACRAESSRHSTFPATVEGVPTTVGIALVELRPACWRKTVLKLASCWAWNVSGSRWYQFQGRVSYVILFHLFCNVYPKPSCLYARMRPQDRDLGSRGYGAGGFRYLEVPPAMGFSFVLLQLCELTAHGWRAVHPCSHMPSQSKVFPFKHLLYNIPPGIALPQCCLMPVFNGPSDWEGKKAPCSGLSIFIPQVALFNQTFYTVCGGFSHVYIE